MIVELFFLSLESAGKNTANIWYLVVATTTLREIQDNCERTFVKPRNSTVNRDKSSSTTEPIVKVISECLHMISSKMRAKRLYILECME